MRIKTTFTLLFLNILLIGVFIYLNKTQNSEKKFLENTRVVIEQTVIDSTYKFEITTALDSTPWIFVKEGDEWIVDSPFRWRANPYAIERFIGLLKTLKWETRFLVDSLPDSGQTLANYGLVSPSASIRLYPREGPPVEIMIGSPTEIGNRLYALSSDKKYIHVLDETLMDGIQRDMGSFYYQNVFSLSPEETRAFQIQDRSAGNVRVRLTRTNDGWKLASPIDTPADGSAVLNALLNITAQEIGPFESLDEMDAIFETPVMRLVLEGFNTRETLLFASPDNTVEDSPYVLAKREAYPTVFQLPSSFLEELRGAQESLRERRILFEMKTDWSALEVRMGNQSTVLQRLENGQWQVVFTASDGTLRTLPAEKSVISDLKNDIEALRALTFVTDAPSEIDLLRFGLIEPQRILLFRKEGRPEVELRIGNLAENETLLYAKTNLAPTVSLVRPFILAEAPLNPLYYRDRSLITLPESITPINVRFVRISDNYDYLKSSMPEELLTEEVKSRIQSWLQNPRVTKFTKDQFENPIRLDRDRSIPWTHYFELEYSLLGNNTEQNRTARIYLSDPVGGSTQFVGSEESNLIGVLPRELISAIAHLFKSNTDLMSVPKVVE